MEKLLEVLEEAKKIMERFEVRHEQFEMMKTTYFSMMDNKKNAVHAPTGTGKSLGYMLPFVAVKLQKPDFKMTISTFTISLQEQLIKDIELANQIYMAIMKKSEPYPKSLKHTILKGKSNYFCEDRFASSIDTLPANVFELIDDKLTVLKGKRTSLDRQNFSLQIRNDQWGEVTVDTCKRDKCSFARDCTYHKDYFLQQSDITVVNHSLYFNRHFFIENAWEEYDFHVFDEAHKLEKVVLSSATYELSSKKVDGWVFQGANLANRHKIDTSLVDEWLNDYLYTNETVLKFKNGLKKLEDGFPNYAYSFGMQGTKTDNVDGMVTLLDEWTEELVLSFKQKVCDYDQLTSDSSVPKEKKEENDKFKEEINFWISTIAELKMFHAALKIPTTLLWIQRQDDGHFAFNVTPESVSSIPELFGKEKGVLLTSGTLAINNSCIPFAQRLNIKLDDESVLPTPFDLNQNTLVYASKSVNPKSNTYNDDLENEIFELLKRGDMKTFVLFTSNSVMKEMHKRLEKKIQAETHEDIEIWLQDKNNYKSVVSSFENESVRSVLFGTMTYFEGIDLKGEKLTQIILARLPFSVPNHPIQELLNKNKGYSEWEALIRFEQAFGRLIRTATDYGTFSILDNRFHNYPSFKNIFLHQGVNITTNMDDIQEFHENRRKNK